MTELTNHQNKILRGLPQTERNVLGILITQTQPLTVHNIRNLVPNVLTIAQTKRAIRTLLERKLIVELKTPGHIFYQPAEHVLQAPKPMTYEQKELFHITQES